MLDPELPTRHILLLGNSSKDQEILNQLGRYCHPLPRWVADDSQVFAALADQDWTLFLIHLDPPPPAAFGLAARISHEAARTGRPLPTRIGLSSLDTSAWSSLRISSGLDSLITIPCQAHLWGSWLAGPVAFDPDELIDRMMGNEILAKRVVEVFLEDAPRQLIALHDALVAQDPERSSRIAHSIRGAAASAGGDALVSLAQGIERASLEGQFEEVMRMLPVLEDRFTRLRPVLERFCR